VLKFIGCPGSSGTALAQDPHAKVPPATLQGTDLWHGESADRDSVCCPGYYNPNPPGRFYGQPLKRAIAARIAYCNSFRGNDITCQAIRTMARPVRRDRPSVLRCKRPGCQQRGEQSGAQRHAFRRVQRLHNANATLSPALYDTQAATTITCQR
jgi:hypothetical protein